MKNKKIYVYDGFYEKGMSNEAIAAKMKEMRIHRHKTVFDSSEPKSIDRLKTLGVNAVGAMKGKDSINTGVDFLQEFEIIVNSHLVEYMTEFNNYCWAVDKDGKPTNKPTDDFNHFIDSLRYSVEHHTKSSAFVFAC
jgi:phage terminase large subunit